MTQMVLPQTPPPNDAGQKPAEPARHKSGDSQFDQVSRAEDKRLARKQAERNQEARQQPEKSGGSQRSEKIDGSTADKGQDVSAGSKPGGIPAEEQGQSQQLPSEEVQTGQQPLVTDALVTEPMAPGELTAEQVFNDLFGIDPEEQQPLFSFAGLQSLAGPKGASGAVPGGTMAGLDQSPGGMLKGMLMMTMGQQEGSTGKTLSAQFSELLSGQSAPDLLRNPDTAALVSQRSAVDLALPQQNPLHGRIPAEAIPLKGYTTSVDVPVGQAQWGDKVMGKLTWLTANNLSVAEIHLTPPDMGPMEVRVQVHQDQTSITVHAANPAVRDQLELHSHRLRDMLGEQGLNLESFDVADSAQQQTGEQASGEGREDSGTDQLASGESAENSGEDASIDLSLKGEVDIYA